MAKCHDRLTEEFGCTCLTLAVPTMMFIRSLPASRWYQLSARACESWSHAEFKTRCPCTSSLTVTLIKTAFPAEYWTAMGQCWVASEVEDAWLPVHCLTESVMQRSRSISFFSAIVYKNPHVVSRRRDKQGPKQIRRGKRAQRKEKARIYRKEKHRHRQY